MAQQFTDREREFLKFQKGRGVGAQEAFAKLKTARERGLFGEQPAAPAAPAAPVQMEEPSAIGKAAGRVGTELRGAGKGLLSTISGVSELGQRGLAKLTGVGPIGGEVTKLPEEITTPKEGEKIGFAVEQIGEFFVPGAAATKVAKVKDAAKALQAAAKVTSKAPKSLQAIATAGRGAARGAAEAGVVGAAQAGEVEGGVEAAKFGAVGGAAGQALGAAARGVGKFARGKVIPTTPTEAGKDLAKGIDIDKVVRGLGFQPSKEALRKNLGVKQQQLGKKLEDVITAASETEAGITAKQLTQGIKKEIIESPAMRREVGLTRAQAEQVGSKIDEVIGSEVRQFGNKKLSPTELQGFKRDLDGALGKVFDASLDKTVKAETAALKQLRKRVQTEIEKVAPEVKEINKELASVITAGKRLAKKPDFRSGLLYDMMAGGAMSSGGGGLGDPVEFAKNFVGGVLLRRGLSSTAVRTGSEKAGQAVQKLFTNPAAVQGLRKALEEED